jgi:DNA invertase Pin-like site-specific DNA recombinase
VITYRPRCVVALLVNGCTVAYDSYIRVSRVGDRNGDSFQSPDDQRSIIQQTANRHGITLGLEVVELDVSGAKNASDRDLETLIQRCESGESEGVIVAYQDRLSRGSLLEQAQVWERLGKAGARLISGDGVDSGSPGQELLFNIRASIARDAWQRYRANWDHAKANAIARGIHVSGRTPVGYLRGEDGRLAVDPKTSDFVRELFEKRSSGMGIHALSRWTHESGHPISKIGVSRLLKNTVYLGVSKQGQYSKEDAHEPLVSRLLFDKCKSVRVVPARKGNKTSGRGLVQGLALCSSCGCHMQTGLTNGTDLIYRCQNLHCSKRSYAMQVMLDELVEDAFLTFAKSMRAKYIRKRKGSVVPMFEQTLKDREYERDLFLSNLQALSIMGEQAYNTQLQKHVGAVTEASANLVQASKTENAIDELSAPLDEVWSDWPLDKKRALLFQVVSRIVVSPTERRGQPLEERVQVDFGEAVAPFTVSPRGSVGFGTNEGDT